MSDRSNYGSKDTQKRYLDTFIIILKLEGLIEEKIKEVRIYWNFEKITVEQFPPNPKEFDNTVVSSFSFKTVSGTIENSFMGF